MADYAGTSRLILNCLGGDERAIEELIRLYETGVYRLALSIVGEPAEADDITQESLIAALSALDSYEEHGSFKTWLYTITLNRSRSRLRKRKILERVKTPFQDLFTVQSQKSISPEESALQNEKNTALWKAMEKLNEKHRLPILLRYFHNLSTAEIAVILNVNEGTIFSRLHFGRERLRKELEESKYFDGE
jgi:RNA polymerase sigma-70 factor, ECF subfamily